MARRKKKDYRLVLAVVAIFLGYFLLFYNGGLLFWVMPAEKASGYLNINSISSSGANFKLTGAFGIGEGVDSTGCIEFTMPNIDAARTGFTVEIESVSGGRIIETLTLSPKLSPQCLNGDQNLYGYAVAVNSTSTRSWSTVLYNPTTGLVSCTTPGLLCYGTGYQVCQQSGQYFGVCYGGAGSCTTGYTNIGYQEFTNDIYTLDVYSTMVSTSYGRSIPPASRKIKLCLKPSFMAAEQAARNTISSTVQYREFDCPYPPGYQPKSDLFTGPATITRSNLTYNSNLSHFCGKMPVIVMDSANQVITSSTSEYPLLAAGGTGGSVSIPAGQKKQFFYVIKPTGPIQCTSNIDCELPCTGLTATCVNRMCQYQGDCIGPPMPNSFWDNLVNAFTVFIMKVKSMLGWS